MQYDRLKNHPQNLSLSTSQFNKSINIRAPSAATITFLVQHVQQATTTTTGCHLNVQLSGTEKVLDSYNSDGDIMEQ